MGANAHEVGARRLLDKMLNDPPWAWLFADTRKRASLPKGHPSAFNPAYINFIGQMWGPYSKFEKWPLEQQAAFVRVHAEICKGLISMVDIVVDQEPSKDKERHENQVKLSDLPHPFEAEVSPDQSGGDCDGTLWWTEPIRAERLIGVPFLPPCRLGAKQGINIPHWVEPDFAPLEIGFTSASRTLLHLREQGAVARWPYGSNTIRLFLCKSVFELRAQEMQSALREALKSRAVDYRQLSLL